MGPETHIFTAPQAARTCVEVCTPPPQAAIFGIRADAVSPLPGLPPSSPVHPPRSSRCSGDLPSWLVRGLPSPSHPGNSVGVGQCMPVPRLPLHDLPPPLPSQVLPILDSCLGSDTTSRMEPLLIPRMGCPASMSPEHLSISLPPPTLLREVFPPHVVRGSRARLPFASECPVFGKFSRGTASVGVIPQSPIIDFSKTL